MYYNNFRGILFLYCMKRLILGTHTVIHQSQFPVPSDDFFINRTNQTEFIRYSKDDIPVNIVLKVTLRCKLIRS